MAKKYINLVGSTSAGAPKKRRKSTKKSKSRTAKKSARGKTSVSKGRGRSTRRGR